MGTLVVIAQAESKGFEREEQIAEERRDIEVEVANRSQRHLGGQLRLVAQLLEGVARAQLLVREGLAQLHGALTPLGVRVFPTAGNFILADVGSSGTAVYELLLREGVIVRPVAGYGLPRCVRITIGTAAQNERVITALSRVL